jgi:hypothetical protein
MIVSYGAQQRIALRLGEQDAVGHQLDAGPRRQPVLEADLVADDLRRAASSARRRCAWRRSTRRSGAAGCGRSGRRRCARPRPSASAIFGSCVVLPEPVSPQTMTTGCRASRRRSRRAAPRPAAPRGNAIVRLPLVRRRQLPTHAGGPAGPLPSGRIIFFPVAPSVAARAGRHLHRRCQIAVPSTSPFGYSLCQGAPGSAIESPRPMTECAGQLPAARS